MTAKQYSEIYIPNCFYPDDFRNYVDFGCCSFVLRSPTDKEAFWRKQEVNCKNWVLRRSL